MFDCDTLRHIITGEVVNRSRICREREARQKAEAENQKLRELCERAIDDAVDALEERDLKRRIADEIESRRKELAALTNSPN